jgi:ATP-dependent Clp protease ATP-binding subunit ClpB
LKLLKAKGHTLTVGKGVLEILVAEGVEPRLGARRMRTTVESHCRHAVREAMLKGGTTSGELVAQNGKLVIQN